jgi:hypothetical protein
MRRFLLMLGVVATLLSPATALAATDEDVPIVPQLNVPIPGLTFSNPEGGNNPLLAQYLSAGYNYLIAISAIVATVMFVWGAFRYMLGSSGMISAQRGKEIMQEAVIGLLLVFGANLILRTINPDTVRLSSLTVDPIETMQLKNEDVLDGSVSLAPGAAATPRAYRGTFLGWSNSELSGAQTIQDPGGSVSQPFSIQAFTMFQGPWANQAYGREGVTACAGKEDRPYSQVQCCTTYARAGCGPTAFATLLATSGVETDPGKVGAALATLGARTCNSGTGFGGSIIARAGQAAGKTAASLGRGLSGVKAAIQELRAGNPVMFLCGGCTGKTSNSDAKTYDGHYMVLNGVDPTGRIFSVFDVGNPNPKAMVNISQMQLASKTGGFWVVKK